MKIPWRTLVRASVAKFRQFSRKRRVLIFCDTILLVLVCSPALLEECAFAAMPESVLGASVTATEGTHVQLNGTRLLSGETLFRGDVITCGEKSSASMHFKNGELLATAGTEVVIEADGIKLQNGLVQVRPNGANTFSVVAPFFRVNIASSGDHAGLAQVSRSGKSARLSAFSGVADILTGGREAPYRVNAGEAVGLEAADGGAGAGQASSAPAAGKLSRLVPDVQISRASQQMIATPAEPVYWNDNLKSGPAGRARVSLTDGSVLSLGSNSQLQVLQHDAQAQQTSLELAVGRMRGQVMKLTRPGAKFEIRTPTGVAGLVGTDFYLLATSDYTELVVFEGIVRFTSFANAQPVNSSAGMKVRISRDGSIAGPLLATAEEIQEAKDSTDVPLQLAGQPTQSAGLLPAKISIIAGAAIAGATLGLGLYLSATVSPVKP